MNRNRPAPKKSQRRDAPAQGESHMLADLRRHVDHLFEEMWAKIGTQNHAVSGRAYTGPLPSADLSETANALEITVELPGMDENDLEVLVTDDRLTIRGEKQVEREEEGRDYWLRERAYGTFERSFPLPHDANGKGTKAEFDKGVLTVTVPRKAGARKPVKKVVIKSK